MTKLNPKKDEIGILMKSLNVWKSNLSNKKKVCMTDTKKSPEKPGLE